MCLIFVANECHEKYKLVIAANRDEFYRRPTLPASFWSEDPNILAGKDIKEGGSWMGITRTGRISALTNFRDPSRVNPQAPSRGRLVQNYLQSEKSPESYLKNLLSRADEYNGFNLIVGVESDLFYLSNQEKLIRRIEKGIHGLSNSLLDVPWPKVAIGKQRMEECLRESEIDCESLFAMMADRKRADDADLPQTGVSLEWERMLSPAFIESPKYGTRSTTVMLIDRDGHVRFRERSFGPETPGIWKEAHFEFDVKK